MTKLTVRSDMRKKLEPVVEIETWAKLQVVDHDEDLLEMRDALLEVVERWRQRKTEFQEIHSWSEDRVNQLEAQLEKMLGYFPEYKLLDQLDDNDLSGHRLCPARSDSMSTIADIRVAHAVLSGDEV